MSTFAPIPDLRGEGNDTDITLLFLSSNVKYYEPVLDPWFKATGVRNVTGILQGTGPPPLLGAQFYRSDRILSVLGCTEQYQFCNTTHCSPKNGIFNAEDTWFGLSLNDAQKVVMAVILDVVSNTTLSTGIEALGPSILLARDSLWWPSQGPISATLMSDQWKREVENLMSVNLAAVQRMVVEFANPPDVPVKTSNGMVSSRDAVVLPGLPQEKAVCRSIRIRDPNYLNFNVIGLLAVFVTTSVIILTNILCVPGLIFWIREKFGRSDFSRREWVMGHLFRLQARLWELAGLGQFSSGAMGMDLVAVSVEKGLLFEAKKTWTSGFEAEFEHAAP